MQATMARISACSGRPSTHRASIRLPPVRQGPRLYLHRPPVAGGGPRLGWQESADLGVARTGAWIVPDERPPGRVGAFLDARALPVYVGFGGMPMRAPKDIARVVKSCVLTYLFILGAIAWLWMAWAVRRRKAWARSAATAICAVAIADAVYNPTQHLSAWVGGQPGARPVWPGS
jgi:hypothetical protein